MLQQYNQKELQGLFEVLPEELKDAILSEQTAETIRKICERYKIEERNMSEIAGLVGNVLMGLFPPENFLASLQVELNIEKEKSQNIFQEINRFIFFPVKNFLIEFYPEIKFAHGGKVADESIAIEEKFAKEKLEKIESEKAAPIEESKETKKTGDDVYREPIE
ncbi:hypothetical protein KKA09_03145 [Patescibacteria group bacterium]|nr:hypothetical protein [Patescibacteria group bacterium]